MDNHSYNDNDPYIIVFKELVNCLPIHNYVINSIESIITYYCGKNNTIILPIDTISPLNF
jgi:hypothetical protein